MENAEFKLDMILPDEEKDNLLSYFLHTTFLVECIGSFASLRYI